MLMKKFGGQTKSNVRPSITCMLIGCPFMFRFHCYLRFRTPSFAVLVLYLFLLLSLYCHLHPFIAFHSSTYLHIVFVAYVSPKLCMYRSFFGLLPSLFVALVAVSSYWSVSSFSYHSFLQPASSTSSVSLTSSSSSHPLPLNKLFSLLFVLWFYGVWIATSLRSTYGSYKYYGIFESGVLSYTMIHVNNE